MTSRKDQKAYAQAMFSQYPELFPLGNRKAILAGRLEIGMTPLEAKVAGGPYRCTVSADPKHWPPDADPEQVMFAQSTQPDDSEILMVFSDAYGMFAEPTYEHRVQFKKGLSFQIETLRRVER